MSPLEKLGAIVAALAMVAVACAPADATTPQGVALPVETTSSSSVAPTTTTTTTTTSTTTTTTAVLSTTTTLPPDPYRTLIATARTSTPHLVALDEPNGRPIPLDYLVPNPHQFGGPLTLMVTEGDIDDEWLKVQVPMRPNGREGWIEARDYVVTHTTIRAEVDLSDRSVKVFDGPELIAESQAAIGTNRTPTPLGTFFIAAKRRNPPAEAFLGSHSIVLSSFSEVLETFSGGLPVIAIHGTNYPNRELGQQVSNGCVRVPNDVVAFLAGNVPIGAPVTISA